MRIAIIINNMHSGGAERVALTLLNTLIDMGHIVTFVLFKEEGPLLSDIPKNTGIVALNDEPTLMAALNPFSGLRKWLKRIKKTDEFDVLLTSSSKINNITVLANKIAKTNIPIVITEHNIFSEFIADRHIHRRIYHLSMAKLLYKKADLYVAVSDYVRKDAIKLGLISADKAHYIHNPIMFREDLQEGLHHWFEDCSLEVVLSVGSFFGVKDYPTLVKAFALLHKKRPQARLIILGRGGKRVLIEGLVKELQIQDYVDMPGFLNPYNFMKYSKVYVCSSKHEASSLAVGEALMAGLNVVSTDCGGPAELLGFGEYGQLVPVGDHEALAAAVEDAIINPISSDVLKDRASNWEPKLILSKYIELINEMLQNRNSATYKSRIEERIYVKK